MKNFPIILDANNKPKAILENAFSVFIKDKLLSDSNGIETLEFDLAFNDKKRSLIQSEDKVLCMGREFILRTIEDDKEDKFISSFFCEATWYDIADGEPVIKFDYDSITAYQAMDKILLGSEWSIGVIDIIETYPMSFSEEVSKLEALREIPTIFGGELEFDSKNKIVHLKNRVGIDTNMLISYEKNIDGIKRTIDTREIITRVYPYGENNLSIIDVNNGIEFVENYTFYDSANKPRIIKALVKKDDRFGNPSLLKQWGESILSTLCKPKVTYSVKVNLTEQILNLGDGVIVYDKNLNIKGTMRIVSRTINVLFPEESELQLDNVLKDLTDQLVNSAIGTTKYADVTSTMKNAFSEITMFNLLLNSRGEDGFNYWINQGFEINNTDGVSGKSCFVANIPVGTTNTEKFIEQEVLVANRSNYVISAQVELSNIIKEVDGKIGFDIAIEFEDGTVDYQFIAIG